MEPNITIRPGDGPIEISQYRPAITSWLVGRTVPDALAQVPLLLPVCGNAQAIAASRAVDAARGCPESPGESARREALLWREQAHAMAWRLTVDWPDLLGEPRQLGALKGARASSDNAMLASHLRGLIAEFVDVDRVDTTLEIASRGLSVPARVVRAALGLGVFQPPGRPALICCERLVVAALHAFSVEPFDALHPWTSVAIEIGPLAMARDPLIPAIRETLGVGPAARLLAMLMDTRAVIRALEGEAQASAPVDRSWPLDPGCGLGVALTARGAVFHRVTVDEQSRETISDWRILAPTDWHFSPDGPVAVAGAGLDDQALEFLAASYDPCAPCRIAADRGSP